MIARRCYGELTGGPSGARVVDAADAWLAARGVVRPDLLAAHDRVRLRRTLLELLLRRL